jgi:hypothetical protein
MEGDIGGVMRIFYDAEFLEDGKRIHPISLGMVREDDKTLYVITADLLLLRAAYQNEWLRKNVIPHLPVKMFKGQLEWDHDHEDIKKVFFNHGHFGIREQVKNFISSTPQPELWGYYSAYDHVVYAQLFGRMIDLPEGFPMFTHDLKQEMVRLGNPWVPEQLEGAHNALADARWNKETYEYLQRLREASEGSGEPLARPARGRVW